MEKFYGWTGLCIEPNPETFVDLQKNRKCLCCNALVAGVSGSSVNFVICNASAMLSGTAGVLNNGIQGRVVPMVTYTLTEILDKANAPNIIEFLSLDTEGTELDILKGIDWNKYRFLYMCIEHNYEEPRRTEVRKFLESKGYQFIRDNAWDDDFIWTKQK